jgi:hypothetical protein
MAVIRDELCLCDDGWTWVVLREDAVERAALTSGLTRSNAPNPFMADVFVTVATA